MKEKREGVGGLLSIITKLLKQKNTLFVVGIAGIVLIFLSDMLFPAKKPVVQADAATGVGVQQQANTYIEEMEQRLTKMISSVEGAGECKVLITLESAGETVYAQDEKNSTETQTSQSGVENYKGIYENQHTLVDGGNGKQPLIETQLAPLVQGVAVVCQGAGDISVVARITEMVSVAFGLSTNRICVTKMI